MMYLPKQSYLFSGLCLAYLLTGIKTSFESCSSNSDCAQGYCCAGLRSIRYCMRNKKLGELCSNTYVNGNTIKCGCQQDLTCAIVKRDSYTGSIQHRCVEIPPEPSEFKDRNDTITSTMTKLLTSIELRRLLKLMEEKPKLKIKP